VHTLSPKWSPNDERVNGKWGKTSCEWCEKHISSYLVSGVPMPLKKKAKVDQKKAWNTVTSFKKVRLGRGGVPQVMQCTLHTLGITRGHSGR